MLEINLKIRNSYAKIMILVLCIVLLTIPSLGLGISNDDIVPLENSDEGEDVSDDIPGPGIPDPGNRTRRIGDFKEGMRGSFVSFERGSEGIDEHIYLIDTDEEVTLFNSIEIPDISVFEEISKEVLYQVNGDRATMEIYDKPSALMKIEVRPITTEQTISFRKENLNIEGREKNSIRIDYGGFIGTLTPYGSSGQPPVVEDDSITYIVEEATTFIFRLDEEMIYGDEEISGIIERGIMEGRIGAEVRVEAKNDGFQQMSVIYDELNLLSQMLNDRTFQLMVSSETLGREGKIIAVDISYSVMDISSVKELNITFDGDEAYIVENYQQLMGKSDVPAALPLLGEEGIQIFVNVPNFSTHTIVIEDLTGVTEEIKEFFGDYIYYIPAAVVTGGLVIFGALYQKKYRKKEFENRKKTEKSSSDKHDKKRW